MRIIKIFKYIIPPPESGTGRVDMNLPRGANVLTAQIQDGNVVLWAEVDPDSKITARTFYIINTGQPLNFHSRRYISTFTSSNGIVWHFYEVFE